jgi:bifunctional UDP-N-acetylglucosamine pyrophosphorylase/glucosamine-1-phosphate N-acetyltransferase
MSRGASGASPIVLVLAAGLGKRMRSGRIKLLHAVAGRPMVAHVLAAARAIGPSRLITVIGHQADEVREAVSELCTDFVLQAEQRGTGHAVLRAAPLLKGARDSSLLILNGDLPTLRPATLRALLARHRRSGAALTLVTAEVGDPRGYGRVVRDPAGRVLRIVEDRDATPAVRAIREINCGIYCADGRKLLSVLRSLKPSNAQREVYLTDAVHRLLARGEKVVAARHDDAEEVLGVNTRAELSRAGLTLYARKAEALQASGVTLLDPSRTWVDPRARVGRDTVIYPGVIVEGPSVIGEECIVRSGCRLVDVVLGRGVEIKDLSVIEESRLRDGASAGPFAHLRPGAILEPGAKVGNFVEVKKSRLGRGTKALHLTYLGDATVGAGCNIGAGTITCNYDGTRKNPTTLGPGVFIGSDTQLVAPVRVGKGAYVAAGTTVTENVPAGALAIGRARQTNVLGWVERRRKKSRQAGRGRR